MSYPNHLSPPVFPYSWASEWGEDSYGLWMTLLYKEVRLVFRWIEPGTFMMGSPEDEKGRFSWEDLHQVTLSQGFWMAEMTVTQALWQAVMGENPSSFKENSEAENTDNYPVENISWDDAHAFIKTLNQFHSELTVRLPWEAEWEYACRAGTQTPFNFAGELSLEKVNYRGTWDNYEKWGKGAKQQTAEVKSYDANAWGLYEMHGNVWEWCEDVYKDNLGLKPVQDPQQQDEEVGAGRVLRAGSWIGSGRLVRSASRNAAGNRNGSIGFRLILGL